MKAIVIANPDQPGIVKYKFQAELKSLMKIGFKITFGYLIM